MSVTLSIGQSNNHGGATALGGSALFHPAVTVWNNDTARTDLEDIGAAFVAPVLGAPPFHSSGANNFGVHAVSHIAALSGESEQLIVSGRAGSLVDVWIDRDNVHKQQLLRLLAVMAAAGVGLVDRLFYQHGESDVTEGWIDEYPNNAERLFAALEDEGIIDATTPIVVGLLTPILGSVTDGGLNDTLRAMVAGSSRNMIIAETASLPFVAVDPTHFTGQGLVRAGRRYVEALSGLDSAFAGIWS